MNSLGLLYRSAAILSASKTAYPCGIQHLRSTSLNRPSRCILTSATPPILKKVHQSSEIPRSLVIRRHFTDAHQPQPPKKKFRLVYKSLKEYGPVFLIFHTCTSIITVTVFYILVSRGFDVSSMVSFAEHFINVDNILYKAGYSKFDILSPASSNATSGIIAFLLYKLTSPIRLLLDSIMVPVLVRNLRYMGLMQPETAVDASTLAKIEQGFERFDNKYDDIIDLEPAVKAIRRRVAKRNERRTRQMVKYTETQRTIDRKYMETQRKIDKVFKKKKSAAESKGVK